MQMFQQVSKYLSIERNGLSDTGIERFRFLPNPWTQDTQFTTIAHFNNDTN